MTTTDERERTVAMVHRCAQHQDVGIYTAPLGGDGTVSSEPAAPNSVSPGLSPADSGIDGHACGRAVMGDPARWCSLAAGHADACAPWVQA